MILLATYPERAAVRYLQELDGTLYLLRWRWLERPGAWYLDLGLPNGTQLAAGIRVVVDWQLLRHRTDPRLPPGQLVAIDTSGRGRDIEEQTELGERVLVFYVTEEEVNAIVEAAQSTTDLGLSFEVVLS